MQKLISSCLVLGLAWGLCTQLNAQSSDDDKKEDKTEAAASPAPEKKDQPDADAADKPAAPADASATKASEEPVSSKPTSGSSSKDKDFVAEFTSSPDNRDADGENSGRTKRLTFKFDKAKWSIVLERFAQEAGLTLDMVESDTPPGTFSYRDGKKYTTAEALDLINGYLLKRGYLLIRRDKFLVCWNIDNAIPPNLIPLVSLEDLPKRGLNEYMSVLIPMGDGMDAKSASEDISDLLGPQGKVKVLSNSNQLKVTDIGVNLREIAAWVETAVGNRDRKALMMKSFKLVFISASEAENRLRELFNLPAKGSQAKAAADAAATTSQSSGSDRRGDRGDRGGRGRGGWPGGGGGWPGGGGGWPGAGGGWPGAGGTPGGGADAGGDPRAAMAAMFTARMGQGSGGSDAAQSATAASAYKISMTADNRGNALLVTATVEEMKLVEEAIKAIDVKHEPSERDGPRNKNEPGLKVYALETADPEIVVDVLNTMVPGLVIYEDTKAHRLNVYAAPSEHKQVDEIIKQIDTAADNLIAVVTLNRLPATAAAASLKGLFNTTSAKGDPPNIEADELGRRLLIRGTPEQVSQIKKLLTDMGEIGKAAGIEPRRGGPRSIFARGKSSAELRELLNDLPDSVKASLKVSSSTPASPPGFQVWDFSEERKESSQDQNPPVRFGSSGSRVTRPAGPREMTLPPGFDPQRIPRTFDGAPGRSEPGRSERDRFNRGADRDSKQDDGDPDAPPAKKEPRSSTSINPPAAGSDVDDLSQQLEAALRERDEQFREDAEPVDIINGQEDEAAANEPANGTQNAPARYPRSRSSTPRGKVEIRIVGDRIRLYSDDPEALDWAETQIEELLADAPAEPEWIIVRLHVADATETASMLNYLFPEGTVPRTQSTTNTGGNFFSMFASRTNATDPATLGGSLSKAGTLKVIADVPSNSLYITGPEEILPKIKQWLRVLDSDDSRKLPRPIEVKYADVEDIAEAVNGLFREETGTGQRQQQ